MEKQLGDCPQWDGFQPISLLGSSEVWCLVLGPPVRRRWCSLILDICIRGLGVAAQSQEIVSSNPGQRGRPGTNGVPAAKWDPTTHDSDKRETRNGGRQRRKERKRKWSQGAKEPILLRHLILEVLGRLSQAGLGWGPGPLALT